MTDHDDGILGRAMAEELHVANARIAHLEEALIQLTEYAESFHTGDFTIARIVSTVHKMAKEALSTTEPREKICLWTDSAATYGTSCGRQFDCQAWDDLWLGGDQPLHCPGCGGKIEVKEE